MPAGVKPEEMAQGALNAYWAGPGGSPLPVDPVVIARAIGINVYQSKMKPGTSGYIVKRGTEYAPDIFFNSEHAAVRQRFTTAHELGHYFQRREMGPPHSDEYFLERAVLAKCGTDEEEIYANQFAAALLMPSDELRLLVGIGFDGLELANQFKVSLESLELRRRKLGI